MLKNNSPTLSPRQIKAGRALLDWSQDDLALATQLSVATIRKLEVGFISPRGSTTGQLRDAFENAGLEFIEPGGVRHKPDDIVVHCGTEGMRSFYDGIYHEMKKKGGEIVVVVGSEVPFTKAFGEYRFVHYDRMVTIRDTVKVRCLVNEDIDEIPATGYCEYRYLPKSYVNSAPFYVYNDKYAIVQFDVENAPKITVIQSHTVAEAFRQQFYSLWNKGTLLSDPDMCDPVKERLKLM